MTNFQIIVPFVPQSYASSHLFSVVFAILLFFYSICGSRATKNICSIRQIVKTLCKIFAPKCGQPHEKRTVEENITRRLIILLHVSKLKHSVPMPFSLAHRLLQFLMHNGIGVQILAPLSVDRSEPFSDEVNVYARVRVVGGVWVRLID